MSCMPCRVLRNLLIVVCLLFLRLTVLAQYGAGIEGTVTDSSGAVAPGAKVTATNQSTGVSRDTLTGGAGFYRISGLAPGSYTITVEATSFRKQSVPDVAITAEA